MILIAVLLFGACIFLHELGHFLSAKACKIRVLEFSVGMGPRLFHFQRGETVYSIRALPVGGFCAFEGETGEEEDPEAEKAEADQPTLPAGEQLPEKRHWWQKEDTEPAPKPVYDEHSFCRQPFWKRLIVLVMGGVMNILFGMVLMGILLAPQDMFATTTISKFVENSPMQQAGIQVGDRLTSIDGYKIRTDMDVSTALAMANPDSVDIVVNRNGAEVAFPNVKLLSNVVDGRKVVQMDFYVQLEKRTPLTLIKKSVQNTYSVERMVLSTLKGLITGRFGLSDVSGPVGMAQAITQTASAGLHHSFATAVSNIVYVIMIITVNLGIVNLLPVPGLDGGKILFIIIEVIRRKPISAKHQAVIEAGFMAALVGFMVLVTISDVMRLATGTGLGG